MKNNILGEAPTPANSQPAGSYGKAGRRFANAYLWHVEGGSFYSWWKDDGLVLANSQAHNTRGEAENDLTHHVHKTWGPIQIVWHQATLEEFIAAYEGVKWLMPVMPMPVKKKFIREITIRIEGDPNTSAIGWGTKEMFDRHIASLHAVNYVADEVERYYQTTLENRVVTITSK